MKKLDYRQLEGKQFVIVWEYNGEIWGGTFRSKNNKLLIYENGIFQEIQYDFMEKEELIVDVIIQE